MDPDTRPSPTPDKSPNSVTVDNIMLLLLHRLAPSVEIVVVVEAHDLPCAGPRRRLAQTLFNHVSATARTLRIPFRGSHHLSIGHD